MQNRGDERLVWRITAAKPEGQDEKKLTLRLTDVATEGIANRQPYHFDSAGKSAPKGGYDFVYPPLMNADVLVTLDADDTVVEVAGLDKLWAGLAGKAQTAEQKSALGETRLALGDKAVEIGLRRLESLMPKGPIGVGDAWKTGVRLELPTIGELRARYDCRLVSVEKDAGGDLAVIEANGVYNLSEEKTVEVQGGKLVVRVLNLQEQATLKVNLATGVVVSDESTRSVTLQATATGGGQQRDVTVRSSARATTTFAAVSSAAPASVDHAAPAPSDHAAPAPSQQPPQAPRVPGGPPPPG